MLNILCGFGAHEIAAAFLAGRAAIEKRIARGKKVLAGAGRLVDLSEAEVAAAVRGDLCDEAMRLVALLLEYPPAAVPETEALAALMCLHAARLPARTDAAGHLHPFPDQDRSRWDRRQVAEGLVHFDRSAAGSAPTVEATDWPVIVSLYDRLLALAPSPVVELSRAMALAQRDEPEQGLDALRAIAGVARLERYPFYAAAVGELELRRGDLAAARAGFTAALVRARSPEERRVLEVRLAACHTPIAGA